MNWFVILRSKTFYINIAAIFTTFGMIAGGEMSWPAAIPVMMQALSNIFLRDSLTNPDKK